MSLVFLPGLFDDTEPAGVFGQFAGMDVIKADLERVGGTIDVAAEADRGTRVSLKLPLTLSIRSFIRIVFLSWNLSRSATPESWPRPWGCRTTPCQRSGA